MKKNIAGFSVVEVLIAVAVIGIFGGLGYVFYNQTQAPTTAVSNSSPATTPSVASDPMAPQINTVSDLTSAQQALDQSSTLDSSDSSQLDSNTSGF
jgi:prepilin-type N-terminal cleavage/methylation domain-containing protein